MCSFEACLSSKTCQTLCILFTQVATPTFCFDQVPKLGVDRFDRWFDLAQLVGDKARAEAYVATCSPCITHWFCTTWLTSTHLQKKCMHWLALTLHHFYLPFLLIRDRTCILALENTWRSSRILRSCPESALLLAWLQTKFNCITALSLYCIFG